MQGPAIGRRAAFLPLRLRSVLGFVLFGAGREPRAPSRGLRHGGRRSHHGLCLPSPRRMFLRSEGLDLLVRRIPKMQLGLLDVVEFTVAGTFVNRSLLGIDAVRFHVIPWLPIHASALIVFRVNIEFGEKGGGFEAQECSRMHVASPPSLEARKLLSGR